MPDKTWHSVVYRDGDRDGVLRLFRKYYGKSEVSKRSFFVWQHQKSPAGKAVIRLAKNKLGKVVGFYGVIPQDFLIGSELVHGSVSVNTLVDDEYRGLGIFTKLACDCYDDCAKMGIVFTIGFPNPNSYPGFVGKLGFSNLGEMPLLLRPLNWQKLLENKLGKKMVVPFGWIFGQGNRKIGDGKENVFEEKVIGDDFDILFDQVKSRLVNTTVRDKKFLKWRLGLPYREYKIFCYRKKGRVVGYLVLRLKEVEGIMNSFIVDFLVDENRGGEEVARRLVNKAETYSLEHAVDLMGCLINSNCAEYKLLKSNGFFVCPGFLKPQPMRVILKWHLGEVLKGFFEKEKWFLTMIDYDVG